MAKDPACFVGLHWFSARRRSYPTTAHCTFCGVARDERNGYPLDQPLQDRRWPWLVAAVLFALPALIMTWCAPEVASWAYAITGAAVIAATGGPAAYCAYRWWAA